VAAIICPDNQVHYLSLLGLILSNMYFPQIGEEEKNELELYKNYDEKYESPIFTYGEQAHCYVEGCELLEEQK
jgi:hypothetical protein